MSKSTTTKTKAIRARRTPKVTRTDSRTAATATATARRRSVFPAHLSATPKEWRALKRQEWLEVTQALDRFRYGSAYAPVNQQLWNIGKLADQITEALKGDWVAW